MNMGVELSLASRLETEDASMDGVQTLCESFSLFE